MLRSALGTQFCRHGHSASVAEECLEVSLACQHRAPVKASHNGRHVATANIGKDIGAGGKRLVS